MATLTTTLIQSITPTSTGSNGLTITFPFVSDKAKGCGYSGNTNGMHTVEYSTANNCVLILKMQGSLSTDPTNDDWVDITNSVYGNGISPVPNQALLLNFTGNFVWVRAVVLSLTAGSINRVQYTHN